MIEFPDKDPLAVYTHVMRSRYGETDKMGYVYYGRYLEYFEVARTEMIRAGGLSYRDLEDSGIMLPVIRAELEYKQPVYYDAEMHIKVSIFERPSVRLRTFYELFTDEGAAAHVLGEVTLCFTNAETRRPCRAPDAFLNLFDNK